MRNYHSSKIDQTCRCHFGGGGGKAPKAPKMPAMHMPPMPAPVQMPAPPAPPPPPPPPPEAQNMSASDAAEQQRQSAGRRSGYRKTILAGETGGYVNPATGAGPNSLLG
jgi:hypothetical protein